MFVDVPVESFPRWDHSAEEEEAKVICKLYSKDDLHTNLPNIFEECENTLCICVPFDQILNIFTVLILVRVSKPRTTKR